MPDTVRALAALQTLLADNTTGDISAQDVRDMLLSAYSLVPDAPTSLDAEDTYWSGSDAAAMTTVTVTGTQTITERVGQLSVLYSGQDTQDYNCLLKAHTFSTGDAFAVPVRSMAEAVTNQVAATGIIFTDGTTAAANAITGALQQTGAEAIPRRILRAGTLTAMASVLGTSDLRLASGYPWAWLRLTYVASNSFALDVSCDGVSWVSAGETAQAFTLTPTHVGVTWSKDASSEDAAATFGPLLKVA